MSTRPEEEILREEVNFWRRFIDHWKRVNKTAPPPRMLEALAQAEHKLMTYRSAKHLERYTGYSSKILH